MLARQVLVPRPRNARTFSQRGQYNLELFQPSPNITSKREKLQGKAPHFVFLEGAPGKSFHSVPLILTPKELAKQVSEVVDTWLIHLDVLWRLQKVQF
jgi:hypothetical protein